MTTQEFEVFVACSARIGLKDDGYNVIGLCGEAGEVAEWVKKNVYRGDARFTNAMLLSELGDVLHYLTRLALNHGFTLKDVMAENVLKITERQMAKETT